MTNRRGCRSASLNLQRNAWKLATVKESHVYQSSAARLSHHKKSSWATVRLIVWSHTARAVRRLAVANGHKCCALASAG